jgi:hypothetical protein
MGCCSSELRCCWAAAGRIHCHQHRGSHVRFSPCRLPCILFAMTTIMGFDADPANVWYRCRLICLNALSFSGIWYSCGAPLTLQGLTKQSSALRPTHCCGLLSFIRTDTVQPSRAVGSDVTWQGTFMDAYGAVRGDFTMHAAGYRQERPVSGCWILCKVSCAACQTTVMMGQRSYVHTHCPSLPCTAPV